MNLLTDTEIPTYSLKEVSRSGNSLFEIFELNREETKTPAIFLTPHRNDYYMLALIRDGKSRHWVDMTSYDVKPDNFYFTVPQQVHLKEPAIPMLGKLICFTDEFLGIEENQVLKQLPIIQNPHNGHEILLSDEDLIYIDDLLNKMLAEYNKKEDWRNVMLLAYLRVLVIYLSRLYTVQHSDEIPDDKTLLKKFRALVNEQYVRVHDVASYAGQLNISAGHLGEVVKQQSGKTAIEQIHDRILLEAKRQLFHTENSIKEIAFYLGFEDASYFNRFFKRLSEQTPLFYRNSTRKMYH